MLVANSCTLLADMLITVVNSMHFYVGHLRVKCYCSGKCVTISIIKSTD